MTRRLLTSAAVLTLLTGGAAQAAVVFGLNPYGNIVNTGLVSTNSGGGGAAAWGDGSFANTAFRGPLPTDAMFFQQTANPATNPSGIRTIFLEPFSRQMNGVVTVATTPGGPVTSPAGTFTVPAFTHGRVDVPKGNFGVRVEVNNAGADNHYQLAEAEFLTINPGPNLALGAVSFNSANSTFGNMADEQYSGQGSTEWRANSNGVANPEQFTGWEYLNGETRYVRALRIILAAPHGTTFVWRDFDLQLKINGVWTDFGRASVDPSDQIYWISLGQDIEIGGVRLFGSTAGGNNPTASGGLIVDDIQAFLQLPEPASAGLLALGALAMLRRRRL